MIQSQEVQKNGTQQIMSLADMKMKNQGNIEFELMPVQQKQQAFRKMQELRELIESVAGTVQFKIQNPGAFLLYHTKYFWDYRPIFVKEKFLTLKITNPKFTIEQIIKYYHSRPSIVLDIQGKVYSGQISKDVVYKTENDIYYQGTQKDMLINKNNEKVNYIGEVNQDLNFHGKGKLTCRLPTMALSVYQGEFFKNKKQGLGFEKNSNSIYQGQWENDQKNGHGIQYVLSKKKKKRVKQIHQKNQQSMSMQTKSQDQSDLKKEKSIVKQEQVMQKITQEQQIQQKQIKSQNASKTTKQQKNQLKRKDKQEQIIQTMSQFSQTSKNETNFQSQTSVNQVESNKNQGLQPCFSKKASSIWKIYKNIYEGNFKNGLRNGKGKQQSKLCIYEGQWKDGNKDGYGVAKYKNGQEYRGQWSNNCICGTGTYIHENKDMYQGEFQYGERHGKGIMKYNNGDQYQGEWVQGKRQGEGIYRYAGDQDYYDGHWYKNLAQGHGTSMISQVFYEGDFSKGKKHGKGQQTDAQGNVTVGIWKLNQLIETISVNGQVV